MGVLNKKEMQTYRDLGAVGVICGRFYDKEGMPVVADVDQRILGISLAQLRQIERKIFLAGGERGYDATLGALLGGYVTDLIVDEGTAEFCWRVNYHTKRMNNCPMWIWGRILLISGDNKNNTHNV